MYVLLEKKIEKINSSLLACCFLRNKIPHIYIAGVNKLWQNPQGIIKLCEFVYLIKYLLVAVSSCTDFSFHLLL